MGRVERGLALRVLEALAGARLAVLLALLLARVPREEPGALQNGALLRVEQDEGARDAVAQWMYKPTLLNGSPVEVITQIDVNFTLSE